MAQANRNFLVISHTILDSVMPNCFRSGEKSSKRDAGDGSPVLFLDCFFSEPLAGLFLHLFQAVGFQMAPFALLWFLFDMFWGT